MDFRRRLIATLRAIQPLLDEPGVLVIGSEVPNLLESGAASTLVVSQDVDIGVPLRAHDGVKRQLRNVVGLVASTEEPSVWIPTDPTLIEVNFVGMDEHGSDPTRVSVLDDVELPLLVFGALGFLRAGRSIEVDGVRVSVPRPAGLILEKLLTDRTSEKGDRDLLVVAGLLQVATAPDLQEFVADYRTLNRELRHVVRSNLTVLSLLDPVTQMPDPLPHRASIAALLEALEQGDES